MVDLLYIVLLVITIISIILTSTICIYSFKKSLQNQSTNSSYFPLIVNLLIITTIQSYSIICNWIPNGEGVLLFPDFLCQLQSILVLWTSVTQDLWVTSIVIMSYMDYQRAKNDGELVRLSKTTVIVLVIVFNVLSIVFAVTLAALGQTGKHRLYCWLPEKKQLLALLIFIFKLLNTIINTVLASIIICSLCKYKMTFGLKVLAYPALQIVASIYFVVYMIMYVKTTKGEVFRIISIVFTSAEGIIYPLIYILTSKIFFCCKKEEENKLSIRLFNGRNSDVISMADFKE